MNETIVTPELRARRRKRDSCLVYAREYARQGNALKVQIWMERASDWVALSDMQIWSIKNLLGAEKFFTLDLAQIPNAETWKWRGAE